MNLDRRGDLGEIASAQLHRLGAALDPSLESARFEAFSLAASTWDRPLDDAPRWSAIGEDYSPYEFSIAFRRAGGELRVLVESHAEPANSANYWETACALNRELAKRYHVPLQNFETVASFFEPDAAHSVWAMWHALRFGRRENPDVRLYLNPSAKRGVEGKDNAVMALEKLGLCGVGGAVALVVDEHTQVRLVALDLSSEPRAKIYFAHQNASVDRLVRIANALGDPVQSDIPSFYRLLVGEQQNFDGEDIRSCFTLSGKGVGAPTQWNVSVPAEYLGTDERARERISRLLRQHGLDVGAYLRSLDALGVPSSAPGLAHKGVTIQREEGEPRVTVYFSPQTYAKAGSVPPDRQAAWAAWCSS